MLGNMIEIWAKKSLDGKFLHYCQINKKHIISIDFEDFIQINLINGITYFADYDVYVSMDSLGLVDGDLDIISFFDGFKESNPDFDMIKYREERRGIKKRREINNSSFIPRTYEKDGKYFDEEGREVPF